MRFELRQRLRVLVRIGAPDFDAGAGLRDCIGHAQANAAIAAGEVGQRRRGFAFARSRRFQRVGQLQHRCQQQAGGEHVGAALWGFGGDQFLRVLVRLDGVGHQVGQQLGRKFAPLSAGQQVVLEQVGEGGGVFAAQFASNAADLSDRAGRGERSR